MLYSLPWGCLYKLQEENLGQRIWDKVRNYWEHVGEHNENLMGMLCEQQKIPTPPPHSAKTKHVVYCIMALSSFGG